MTNRIALLRPLAERDFALLWLGRATSLLGDGVYVVALAWAVFDLSNAPAALSIVGIALTVPQVAFFLIGGVVSDRVDRRHALIAADLLRMIAIGSMGLLAVTGGLALWHVVALAILVGVGDALFNPAFSAIVPDVVPEHLRVQANAFEQTIRPLALRLIGPVLGGAAIATVGAGGAFLLNAATFAVSATALSAMRARPVTRTTRPNLRADLAESLAFVRGESWLWGSLLMVGFSLLVFWGPFEVLLPFVIKNELGGSASDFGLLLAAGGVGGIGASLYISHRGLPEHKMPFLYIAWALMMSSLIGYGLIGSVWQGMVIYCFAYAMNAAVMVTWATMLQDRVPREMLGRISSLDWVMSYSLIPLSFVLTGPLAAALGAQTVLIGAGVLGASGALLTFFLLHASFTHPQEVPA